MARIPVLPSRKELEAYTGSWTYRYYRSGRPAEKHFDTADLAIKQATYDIESLRADPIHIRAGTKVVYEAEAIYKEWEHRFLC